jgi:hypothetical protein
MHQPARFVASLTGIIVSVTTQSVAGMVYGLRTAAADGSTMVPLSINLKRCDTSYLFQQYCAVLPATRQTTYIVIIRTIVNVTPKTHLVEAAPATICGLRLVEMSRSGVDYSANEPGIAVSSLNIEWAGTGTATVQDSVIPGATGAWISVERPFLLRGERFDGAC